MKNGFFNYRVSVFRRLEYTDGDQIELIWSGWITRPEQIPFDLEPGDRLQINEVKFVSD